MKQSNFNKKRLIKNIIAVLLIAAVGTGFYFTLNYAKSSTASQQDTNTQFQMQSPPSDSSQSSDSSESSESSDSSDASVQPDSQNQGQAPDNGSSNSQNQTPPEKPDSSGDPSQNASMPESSESSQSTSTDSSPSDSSSDSSESSDSSDSNSSGMGGNMPDGAQPGGSELSQPSGKSSMPTVVYILFAAEGAAAGFLIIYLIMSRFNKKTFKQTFKNGDKIIICILSVIIITGAVTFGGTQLAGALSSDANMPSQQTSESQSADASGATQVDSDEETLTSSYTSSTADESAILVTNSGSAEITGATITKSGDSTNTENSEFYGINSGILVQSDSTATIKDSDISTSATGSNAVFSTGENSKIYISDTKITTTGESSARGLDATYGGYIEADNVDISTQGGSCAALATDRGEGTVTAKNSTLKTAGSGSPLLYSTGNISVSKTTGTASGSQIAVIEGKNSATVESSTLSASAAGNRGDVDVCGVMIYQSMSGDADEGTGTFTAKNSSLSIDSSSDYYKSAPMFFCTNTDAVINLENTKLSFGSSTLLSAKATDEWGNSGSNGADVELNADSQTLVGDITADSLSSVDINLTSSSYKGCINNSDSAKEINLKLDSSSSITLTGDTYVTSLDDDDSDYSNIDFNGYKLYVNSKAINS